MSLLEQQWEGIAPSRLLSQVLNTAPFLFEEGFKYPESSSLFIDTLRKFQKNPVEEMSLVDFFHLNLSCHYATVATFVPTDVDLHIRFKLWKKALSSSSKVADVEAMAKLVLAFQRVDVRPVSTRYVYNARKDDYLAGHMGEWFSVAVAAYAASLKINADLAAEIAAAIVQEVERHEAFFKGFLKEKNGVNLLIASTIIAHNFGDLDRVFDAWHVPDSDALKKQVYKKGHGDLKSPLGLAGELNKVLMAKENHRHYPLRTARSLRRSEAFLAPTAPFFDDWGQNLMQNSKLTEDDLAEIVQAMVEGWVLLNEKVLNKEHAVEGYARALCAMEASHKTKFQKVLTRLPSKIEKILKGGGLRLQMNSSKVEFERRLSTRALKICGLA